MICRITNTIWQQVPGHWASKATARLEGQTSNASDAIQTAGGSWQTADTSAKQYQRLACRISLSTVELTNFKGNF